MKKNRKIFIAVDTNSASRAKKIIQYTKTSKLKIYDKKLILKEIFI